MVSQGFVSENPNCGFFDMYSMDTFEIVNPGNNLSRILGLNPAESPEGLSYIDLVCPEDKEQVMHELREVFEDGMKVERPGKCIRHRLMQPDENVISVSLTFGYNPKGFLVCSVFRLYNDIGRSDNENKYRSNNVLESFAISMAVVFINNEGQIIVKYANNDFFRMIGLNRLEFKDFFNECLGDDIIYPDDFDMFRRTLESMSDECRESVFEARVLNMNLNGKPIITEVRTRFIESENDKPLITVVFYDITERKQLRRELTIKNERFNIIQQNSEQTIFDYDTEKDVCILSGNTARIEKYLSVYQYNRRTNEVGIEDFFNGRFSLNIMSKEDYQRVCEYFADSIVSGDGNEFDFQACATNQTSGTWFRCTYSAVKDDMGSVIRLVGKLKNIDKQKKSEQLMERRMKSDALTGLLNKETAKARIRGFFASQGSARHDGDKYHALMIIDLDNFHLINEYFGHTFGDNVLKEFASDVKSSFRDTDIVSRLVGDRFMVLMKDVTHKFAVKKAGRLCRSMIKSYGVQNTIVISCSIGVAFFDKDASDFDELYQYADRAAYEAKKNGKNAYCIYDSEIQSDDSIIKEISQSASPDTSQIGLESGDIDSNIIDIAMSLLATSDDIYGTLDILLRTVGRKYNLSAVSLYIKGYNPGEKLKTVCRWISNRNLPVRDGRSPLVTHHVDLDAELGSSGIRCIADVSASNLHPELKTLLKNDGIISLVICRLEGRSGKTFGYAVFTQFERRRKWSRKECNTFRYLAKILSVALAEKYARRAIIAKGIDELPPKNEA